MTPSIEAAVKIATILETNVGYLLGETDNLIETMLTKKKFKDFFTKNVAAL